MSIVRSRKRSTRRGAALVETAIVLTTFFILVFGFFETARIIMMRQLLENAAREGARAALVSTNTATTANIQSVVNSYLASAALQNVNIQVYQVNSAGASNGQPWTNTSFGNGIAVQIDADYHSMLPTMGLVSSALHFEVKAIMRCEAN
jgi:Flp pilus assembly protein TadG